MSDDFFSKLDSRLAAEDEQAKAASEAVGDAREQTKARIAEFRPIIESYQAKLAERNIATKFHAGDEMIELAIEFNQGGYFGYRVEIKRDDGTMKAGQIFREDGKSCGIGEPSAKHSTVEGFENALKAALDESFTWAKKQGGVRRT